MRKPKPYPLALMLRAVIPVLTAIPSLAAALGKPMGTADSFLGVTNWTWVALGAAWLAGAVLADLSNPEGFLKEQVRWRFRIFDVEHLIPATIIEDDLEFLLIKARLLFVRDALLASLKLDIAGTIIAGSSRQPHTKVFESNRTFVRGERYECILAYIPIRRHPAGPLPPMKFGLPGDAGVVDICAGSTNVLSIVLTSGLRQQTYRVHLRMIMSDDRARGRVLCVSEDHDLFEPDDKTAFT